MDQKLIWEEYVVTFNIFQAKVNKLMLELPREQLIMLFKDSFLVFNQTEALLYMLERLPIQDLQLLLPELVGYASTGHSRVDFINKLILKMPKVWLAENIEQYADKFLSDDRDEEYWQFLGLYKQIDKDLMLKLAKRAIVNPNPHIRDAGETYIEQLGV